jgi:hypothetical protein
VVVRQVQQEAHLAEKVHHQAAFQVAPAAFLVVRVALALRQVQQQEAHQEVQRAVFQP